MEMKGAQIITVEIVYKVSQVTRSTSRKPHQSLVTQ